MVVFPDGEMIVENNSLVQNKKVYVVQSTYRPVTDHLFELLIFCRWSKTGQCQKNNGNYSLFWLCSTR